MVNLRKSLENVAKFTLSHRKSLGNLRNFSESLWKMFINIQKKNYFFKSLENLRTFLKKSVENFQKLLEYSKKNNNCFSCGVNRNASYTILLSNAKISFLFE